jgi:hypothetical protein
MLPGDMAWDVQFNPTSITLTVDAPHLTGDFNRNGTVDAADYVLWRRSLGQTGNGLPADGDGDGRVDQDDYGVWRGNFGRTAGSLSGTNFNATVPEPGAGILLVCAKGAFFSIALLRRRVNLSR